MGYSVSGGGSAKIKAGTETGNLLKELEELAYALGIEDCDIDENNGSIGLTIYDSHWDEEDTIALLSALNEHITEGSVEFRGECDEFWRYVFNSEAMVWDVQNGQIVYEYDGYSDTELIKELEKRGYTVSKKAA